MRRKRTSLRVSASRLRGMIWRLLRQFVKNCGTELALSGEIEPLEHWRRIQLQENQLAGLRVRLEICCAKVRTQA